jgi:triphosphoribosyl-dephospho-CoA synthetase
MTEVLAKELERERTSGQRLMEENITLRGQMYDIEAHYCETFNRLLVATRREDMDAVVAAVAEMKRYIKEGNRPACNPL